MINNLRRGFSLTLVILFGVLLQNGCSSGPLPIPDFSTSEIAIPEPDLGSPYIEPIVIVPNLKVGNRIRIRSVHRSQGNYSLSFKMKVPGTQDEGLKDTFASGNYVIVKAEGGVPSHVRGEWNLMTAKKQGSGEAWIEGKGEIQGTNDPYTVLGRSLKFLATPHESLPEKVRPLKVGDSWTKDLNSSWTTESRLLAVGKKNGRVYAKIKTIHSTREKIEKSDQSIVNTVVFDVATGLSIFEYREWTQLDWSDYGFSTRIANFKSAILTEN